MDPEVIFQSDWKKDRKISLGVPLYIFKSSKLQPYLSGIYPTIPKNAVQGLFMKTEIHELSKMAIRV
jgi:hypothetical protein